MINILDQIKEIETREDILNSLILKRDNLIKELNDSNSHLPVILEKNKKLLIFKRNNDEYLDTFNQELLKVEQEQSKLINNIKTIHKDQISVLEKNKYYTDLKLNLNLNKQEVINLIYNDLIDDKLSGVDFVS